MATDAEKTLVIVKRILDRVDIMEESQRIQGEKIEKIMESIDATRKES